MATIPNKAEISDSYPNPSNEVARVGFGRLYDWVRQQLGMWVPVGGTADALAATYSPAITSLEDGQVCQVRALAANATATPTFAPNGLTARVITMLGGAALKPFSIAGAGHELILRYSLAGLRWELLNPAVIESNYAVVSGANATGTWPIAISGTAAVATLANTIANGIVTAVKIAANTITLDKLARTGATGQVLLSGGPGADPSWGTIDTGMPNTMVKFSASGTWTRPVGCKSIMVQAWGGSGGGGLNGTNSDGVVTPGADGQGSLLSTSVINVTATGSGSVTVGAAGTAGWLNTYGGMNYGQGVAGGAGGLTTVSVGGMTVASKGGAGGKTGTAYLETVAGGVPSGTAIGTSINFLLCNLGGSVVNKAYSPGAVSGNPGVAGGVLITEYY